MWEGLFNDGAPTRLLKSWSKSQKESQIIISTKVLGTGTLLLSPGSCCHAPLCSPRGFSLRILEHSSSWLHQGSLDKRVMIRKWLQTNPGLLHHLWLETHIFNKRASNSCLQPPRKTQILHLWARAPVLEVLLLVSCGLLCFSLSKV